jgi:hypothetical protein
MTKKGAIEAKTLSLSELRAAVESCADLDKRTRRAVLSLLTEEDR